MKGLLLKDWYQVKTNMWMMYLTVLAVLAIWILSTSGDSSFAVNYSAVFLGMMPAYLLSYDHASGWTEYSFALPLSKELQVAEKYLVGLLCTAVSAALNGIFCGIRFWMGKPLPAMPISLLLGAGAASILLINGIMLPLYYRFGAEKARMLYMLMFAGMGAALGGGTVLMDAVPEPARPLPSSVCWQRCWCCMHFPGDCQWHGMESIRSKLFFVQYSNNPVKKL